MVYANFSLNLPIVLQRFEFAELNKAYLHNGVVICLPACSVKKKLFIYCEFCQHMMTSNGRIFRRYWPFMRGIHRSAVNSAQRPVTRSFDVFLDLRLNKPLSKQSWGWWFERLSRPPLWRQCNRFRVITTRREDMVNTASSDRYSLISDEKSPNEKVVINQLVLLMCRFYIQMRMRYGSACDVVFPDDILFITIAKFRLAANLGSPNANDDAKTKTDWNKLTPFTNIDKMRLGHG